MKETDGINNYLEVDQIFRALQDALQDCCHAQINQSFSL